MSTAALNKIAANSPSRQSPSELEKSIANALYDLETNIQDMRSVLRPLQFVSAREVSLVLLQRKKERNKQNKHSIQSNAPLFRSLELKGEYGV